MSDEQIVQIKVFGGLLGDLKCTLLYVGGYTRRYEVDYRISSDVGRHISEHTCPKASQVVIKKILK